MHPDGAARAAATPDREAAKWWETRLKAERIIHFCRTATIALMTVGWLFLPDPAANGRLAWVVLGATWVYIAGFAYLLVARPAAAGRLPNVLKFVDMFVVIAWILATGGRQSPYKLLPAIVSMVPMDNVPAPFVIPSELGLAFFYGWLAGPQNWFAAVLVVVFSLEVQLRTLLAKRKQLDSRRDSLTGALTREYGLFTLRSMLADATHDFTMGMLDLDRFKTINDTYGHVAGDAMLRQCVLRMSNLVRPDDLLIRLGGDEFLVVFSNLPLDHAMAVARRISVGVQNTAFFLDGIPTPVPMTLSMGLIAVDRKYGPEHLSRLIADADRALYEAKENRNQVVSLGAAGAT